MNHQKLRCYEVLLDAAKKVPHIVAHMPRGHNYIVDQLRRALSSSILNLAEGNGRTSHKERARFFDISLASLAESSSAIDVMCSFGLIAGKAAIEIKSQFRVAYAMIVKLKHSS